jgi:hypothetical protein
MTVNAHFKRMFRADVAKCKTLLDVRSKKKSKELQVFTTDPRKEKPLAIFQRETNHTNALKNGTKMTTEIRPIPTSLTAYQHNRYLYPVHK